MLEAWGKELKDKDKLMLKLIMHPCRGKCAPKLLILDPTLAFIITNCSNLDSGK
jgi:hypothetical protein